MMACVADRIVAGAVRHHRLHRRGGGRSRNFHRLPKKNDIDVGAAHRRAVQTTLLTLFGENTIGEKFQQDLNETHELFKRFA